VCEADLIVPDPIAMNSSLWSLLTLVLLAMRAPFAAADEPLYGLGCQESVRDLVPFFLALLTFYLVGSPSACASAAYAVSIIGLNGFCEVTRIETAFGLRARFSLAVTSGQADCWRDALKPISDGRPRSARSWPRRWHQRQCRRLQSCATP